MQKINIAEKLSTFDDVYVPMVVGELNGQYVKVVKFVGPYVMHKHDNEDEMFLVVKGSFDMEYEDRPTEPLNEGEFVIIPRGVMHRPNAAEEVHVMLFEPKETVNTGGTGGDYTLQPDELKKI